MCMKKTLLFVCGLLMCMSTQAADFEKAKDAVTNMDFLSGSHRIISLYNRRIPFLH